MCLSRHKIKSEQGGNTLVTSIFKSSYFPSTLDHGQGQMYIIDNIITYILFY